MAEEVKVNVGGTYADPAPGSAGLETQVPGAAVTVSNAAGASGGIEAGNFIESDIDKELFKFEGDDNPLMQLMLAAKTVKVDSPIVDHYAIDEPRYCVHTGEQVSAGAAQQFVLPLETKDSNLPRANDSLLAVGVDGYEEDGVTVTPGKSLLLYVVGSDTVTGNPVVRAINGPKTTPTDEYCKTPAIPAGTTFIIGANALYETQKEVDPGLIIPNATRVYLQKRGMNQVVSDYFEAQKKRIPFAKALIAEAQIKDFKTKGNRTLYMGVKGKVKVQTKIGVQDVYFTEGVRYQVRKELQHPGKWTVEKLIALAKLVFTGEDVPKSVVILAGKNFLENIQCIDYTKHPEFQITTKTNTVGWTVTNIHTVFGDFEIKHDPTLNRIGCENSAFVVDPSRLVHYVYKEEHQSSDRVEGEEATRTALLVWDALALKGSCHVWINGETTEEKTGNAAISYIYLESDAAPESPVEGVVYYLLKDCPGINKEAVAGTLWQYKNTAWVEYTGEIVMQ